MNAPSLTHGVDCVLENKCLSLDRDGNLLAEISVRDCSADGRNVAHLFRVPDCHGVEMADKLFPDTALILHLCFHAQLALDSLSSDLDDLFREVGQL